MPEFNDRRYPFPGSVVSLGHQDEMENVGIGGDQRRFNRSHFDRTALHAVVGENPESGYISPNVAELQNSGQTLPIGGDELARTKKSAKRDETKYANREMRKHSGIMRGTKGVK